ncbi:MAG TPA: hypothetical protein VGH49_01210 [Xanthobacteraceae bacterium]
MVIVIGFNLSVDWHRQHGAIQSPLKLKCAVRVPDHFALHASHWAGAIPMDRLPPAPMSGPCDNHG